MTSLLKFTSVAQALPQKRSAKERKGDFNEIYGAFSKQAAEIQASRCSQCGVPFCQVHCPLQNNIPDWLKLTAEGRLKEAYLTSAATNTFPEICGRICPQDRLCEGNCVIEKGFNSVTIGSVEKYLTETAFDNGWVLAPTPSTENGLSVGIIGAGPAGLAAADILRRRGYSVDVYDRYDRMGGLLIYGIPNFKLEKDVVQRRYELLKEAGIKFHFNCSVGQDITFAELRSRHNAILIATGVYKARELSLLNSGLSNVVQALPYLTANNKVGLGDKVPEFSKGAMNAKGKHVVVIGGGDTAMDCVRTAVRQGAKKVTCLYRRDKTSMPGSAREVAHAEEEGVEFQWLSAPKAFVGKTHIEQIIAVKMRPNSSSHSATREIPVVIENSDFTIKADLAILALGFEPEHIPTAFGEPNLKLSKYGTLSVDAQSLMTSLPGVFAAGDIVRGASLVVWAIKDGREAAEGMDAWIQHQQTTQRKMA